MAHVELLRFLVDTGKESSPGISIKGSGKSAETGYRSKGSKDGLVLGAPGDDANGSFSGTTFIIPLPDGPPVDIDLSSGGPPGSRGWDRIIGAGPSQFNGLDVGAGDFNGDGITDPFTRSGGTPTVVFGTDGPERDIFLDDFSPDDGTMINAPGAQFIDSAGDLNGDGKDEIGIGRPFGSAEGQVFIFPGDDALPGTLDISNLPPGGIEIIGANSGDRLGHAFGHGGSVDGDGFNDVIIGAPGLNGGGIYNDSGGIFIVHGGPGLPAKIDLGTPPPDTVSRIESANGGGLFGSSVAVGDFDGDGMDDIIGGAPDMNSYGGGIFIVYGSSNLPAVTDLGGPNTGNFTLIMGTPAGDRLGYSLASGDVNGDGMDDIIAGTPGNDDGGAEAGGGFVIFGHKGRPAMIDVSDNENSLFYQGEAAGDEAGLGVFAGLDYNSDGVGDFGFTAPFNDASGDRSGKVYVLFGEAVFGANDDKVSTPEDMPITIDVLGNDTGGGILTIIEVGDPGIGQATIVENKILYAPDDNLFGTDTFTYTITNGDETDAATVTVTVDPVNDAPVAVDDTATGDQNLPVDIPVLGNDSDVEGDPLTVSGFTNPTAGSLQLGVNDVFTYTPDLDFVGLDTFTYTIDDGNGGDDTATVTVTINSLNGPPNAVDDKVITDIGLDVLIDVLANDSDPESDPLTITTFAAPSHGIVLKNQDDTFSYVPEPGFRGQDSFTYTVSDGNGGSDTASVSIQVGPPPIRIVAGDGAVIFIGGNGDVFGTNFDGGSMGRQDITFVLPPVGVQQMISLVPEPLALAGDANDFDLDGSFGRGGDVLRFAGDAGGYTVAIQGVAAEISDGFSSYALPIGTAGLVLVFDDGARTLAFDTGSGEVMLGSQTVTATPAQITAPDDGTQIPDIGNPDTVSRAVLFENAQALLGGTFDVFGTNDGAETVGYVSGDLALDGSFARGGDEVSFEGPAATYSAYLSGTSLILLTPEGQVAAPVGVAGLTLDFAGDERTLAFDAGAGQVMIGDQAITATTAGAAQVLTAEGFA